MIHIETSPIEYLFWIVVILGLLICIACMVLLCWLSVSRSHRKGTPVKVHKKAVPTKPASKRVAASPVFDTATFVKVYVETHPDLKQELKEELCNG